MVAANTVDLHEITSQQLSGYTPSRASLALSQDLIHNLSFIVANRLQRHTHEGFRAHLTYIGAFLRSSTTDPEQAIEKKTIQLTYY